jgi:sialate O-acetylesterase
MAKLIPIAINHYEYPSMLYNGMINPLIPFGIKGVIWYQGESNVARAKQYGRIFPGLITDWRNHWGQGDFPFLFVSLANYRQPAEIPGESEFAELRESQVKALSLPNTGMATAIDIGDAREFVHPENKQDVGYRLALNALQTVYKKDVEGFSPMFESMKLDGSKVEIIFNHVGKGLVVKDRYGYINGFAVAGNDKKFHWAKAELINDHTVRISSSMVEKPVAVRFGWSDNPSIWNLYSKDGLPAHPFRTDSWSRKEK